MPEMDDGNCVEIRGINCLKYHCFNCEVYHSQIAGFESGADDVTKPIKPRVLE